MTERLRAGVEIAGLAVLLIALVGAAWAGHGAALVAAGTWVSTAIAALIVGSLLAHRHTRTAIAMAGLGFATSTTFFSLASTGPPAVLLIAGVAIGALSGTLAVPAALASGKGGSLLLFGAAGLLHLVSMHAATHAVYGSEASLLSRAPAMALAGVGPWLTVGLVTGIVHRRMRLPGCRHAQPDRALSRL